MISRHLRIILAGLAAAFGCAPAPTEPARTPGPTEPATAPAAELSDLGPAYKPSTSSPEPIPIASNAYGAYGGAPQAPEIGDVAADFELPTIDGGTFKLSEAQKAGPVMIMFYRGFW